MAFVPDFTTSQVLGQPSQIVIANASTGSDAAITSRRIYLTDNAGNVLVETGNTNTYTLWPLADNTITLDVLTRDTALLIRVDYLNISGTILYPKSLVQGYILYMKTYYLFIVKSQSSNNDLVNKANFYDNEIKLLCSMQEATTAIGYEDISSAQAAMNRGHKLINTSSYFF